MASWVTHLMIADGVLKEIPTLCRRESRLQCGECGLDCVHPVQGSDALDARGAKASIGL